MESHEAYTLLLDSGVDVHSFEGMTVEEVVFLAEQLVAPPETRRRYEPVKLSALGEQVYSAILAYVAKHITPGHGPSDQQIHAGESSKVDFIKDVEERLARQTRSIESGELTVLGRIGVGITGARYGMVGNTKVVVKSTDADFERAAFLTNGFLGSPVIIPPTIVREHDGTQAMVQKFVSGASQLGNLTPARFAELKDQTLNIALYDSVIGNIDRHGGNVLEKGRLLIAIDHGFAFFSSGSTTTVKLRDVDMERLRKFSGAEHLIRQRLVPMIGDDLVNSMFDRVRSMLKSEYFATIPNFMRYGIPQEEQ